MRMTDPSVTAPPQDTDDTPATPTARRGRARRLRLDLPPELAGRSTVDRFTLGPVLGQGGMSWLLRATEGPDGPAIALKILDPELAREHTPEHLDRFGREARAATRVRHPNVVAALDQGRCPETGLHWIAYELVDGISAEDLLAVKGPLPEAEALAIALDVAQGLGAIAEAGIVHRDGKPTNILVGQDGRAKLTDLGMAKILGEGGLTQVGAVLGTPHYIAPEQAVGLDEVDARADLYALGVTLFRLLTGRFPFEGDAFIDVVTRHVNEELPDPRGYVQDLSEATAKLLVGLAARDPADRYRRAQAAAEDIARVLLGQEPLGPRGDGRVSLRPVAPAPAPVVAGPGAEDHEETPPAPGRRAIVAGRSPPPRAVASPTPGGAASSAPTPRGAATPPRSGAVQRPPLQPPPEEEPTEPLGQDARRALPEAPVPEAPVAEAPVAEAPASGPFRLVLSTGGHVLARGRFDKDLVTIGRDPKSDLPIDNPMVSRHHAELRRAPAGFSLHCLGSTNGSYVNGDRVPANGGLPVRPGDKVGLAKKFDLELVLDLGQASPSTPTPRPQADAGPPTPTRARNAIAATRPFTRPGVATPVPEPRPVVTRPGAATPVAPSAPARPSGQAFAVFDQGGRTHREPIDACFQVGKAPECQLRLDGAYAPRKALVIFRGVDRYHLVNTSPYPRTVELNGQPVDDVAVLQDGDRIAAYGVTLSLFIPKA